MKQIVKRVLAAGLSFALVLTCLVSGAVAEATAAEVKQAYLVERQIAALSQDVYVFNNCDDIDSVVNPNSGSWDKAAVTDNIVEGTGAAKLSLKNPENLAPSTCEVAFRHNPGDAGLNPADYENFEFDVYLSEGITMRTGGYGNVFLQTAYENTVTTSVYTEGSTQVGKISATDYFNVLQTGWNHVVIPVGSVNMGETPLRQIGVRFGNMFQGAAAGDYVLFDNAVLTKAKTITASDKDAVNAAKAAYDALSDEAKALIPAASVTALEQAVAIVTPSVTTNMNDIQFRALDKAGWHRAGRGVRNFESARYDEGVGSVSFTLDTRGGWAVMNGSLIAADDSSDQTATKDISAVINENGDFYLTFDMFLDESVREEVRRLVIGLGCRTESNTNVNSDARYIEIIKQVADPDWSVFGIDAAHPQPGWNHCYVKITNVNGDCNFAKAGVDKAALWDPTVLWQFLVGVDAPAGLDGKIYFDDIRFMGVDAFEANFASTNAVKDVVGGINEATTDEEVAAARAAYNALSDEQKAKVTNLALLETKEMGPVDVQFRAMDSASDLAAAAQAQVWAKDASRYVEGSAAVDYKIKGTGELHFYFYTLGQRSVDPVDATGADYLTFDMYVPRDGIFDTISSDAGVNVNASTAFESWGDNCVARVSAANVKAALSGLKAGWNHVVMPFDGTANGATYTMRLYMLGVNSVQADDIITIDDVRFINTKMLNSDAYTSRNAVKDVIGAINEMNSEETYEAAHAAYEALTPEEQAQVTNADKFAAFAGPTRIVWHAVDALSGTNIEAGQTDARKMAVNAEAGYNEQYLEGTNALWTTGKEGSNQMFFYLYPAAIDITNAKYLTFDLYISKADFHPNNIADANVSVSNTKGAWADKGNISSSADFKSQLKAGAGWNHVVLPVNFGGTTADFDKTNLASGRIYMVYNGSFAGEKFIIDDIAFLGANGLEDNTKRVAAKDVAIEIYALPEATLANAEAINAVKADYDALDEDYKQYVVNADALTAALAGVQALQDAVDAVIAAIDALNVQSLDDEAAVTAARNAYNALSAEQKALVTNTAKLDLAEAKIDELYDAADDAAAVDAQIAALTGEDAEAVAAARAAYEALSDLAKSMVTKLAELEAAEQAVAVEANMNQVVFRSMDTIFRYGAGRPSTNPGADNFGGFIADTSRYNEGSASVSIKLDGRSQGIMNLMFFSADGTEDQNTPTDISSVINENGDFYLTFDLFIEGGDYLTMWENSKLNVKLISRTDENTNVNDHGAWLDISHNANTSWTDFGIADGHLKAGWNHFAIKITDVDGECNYGKAGNHDKYWDATKLWKFEMNWVAGYDNHATDAFYIDDVRVMGVGAYEANFASTNAVKDVVGAINELNVQSLDDEPAVQAARAAYNALSDEQKALVTNESKLALAEQQIEDLRPQTGIVVDGVKDDAYTDDKLLVLQEAYGAANGGNGPTNIIENATELTVKTWYNWDDEFNYVFMEITEPGYGAGDHFDVVYYKNNTSDANGLIFQNAGGGYWQVTVPQNVASYTAGGNVMPAEFQGSIDMATGQTRQYEFKFARDPAADGFSISPVGYVSASDIVAYGSFYNTSDYKVVKYEDDTTWAETKASTYEPPAGDDADPIDGVKGDFYTDDKMLIINTAYGYGYGEPATDNVNGGLIKTWYNWDDNYIYVYEEISVETYEMSWGTYDNLWFVNNTNAPGDWIFQAPGGFLYSHNLLDNDRSQFLGSSSTVVKKANTIDGATGTPRTYEFKIARDPEADGFQVGPALQVGQFQTDAGKYFVAYDSVSRSVAKVVKFEDNTTWYEEHMVEETYEPFTYYDGVTKNDAWNVAVATRFEGDTEQRIWVAQEFVPANEKLYGASVDLLLTGNVADLYLEVRTDVNDPATKVTSGVARIQGDNTFKSHAVLFDEAVTVQPGKKYYLIAHLNNLVAGNIARWSRERGDVHENCVWRAYENAGEDLASNPPTYLRKENEIINFALIDTLNSQFRAWDAVEPPIVSQGLFTGCAESKNNYLEGTGAVKFNVNAATGDILAFIYSPQAKRNVAGETPAKGAEYLLFDLYVSDASLFNGKNVQFGIDDYAHESAWNSLVDITGQYFNDLHDGWNHVKVQIPALSANVSDIRMIVYGLDFSAGAPTILMDDIRFAGAEYVAGEEYAAVNAAKDVSAQIWALPDAEHVDVTADRAAVEAARAAYDALNDAQKALVVNLDKLEQVEAKIANPNQGNMNEVVFRSMDSIFRYGAARPSTNPGADNFGGFVADSSRFNEGTASVGIKLDSRSQGIMHLMFISADGTASQDTPIDISSVINENGDFYLTFDLFIEDGDYLTMWENSKLNVKLISRTANNTNVNGHDAWLDISHNANTSWTDFGIEGGHLKAGWNHFAIKITDVDGNCNYGNAGNSGKNKANCWDATSLWKFEMNWVAGYDKHATDAFYIDDIRVMGVGAYEEKFASRNQVKDVIGAINEASTDEEIAAVVAAYEALTDEQKAEVSNYAVLHKLTNVIYTPVKSLDTNAGVVIAGGNQANGVPGAVTTENYLEGTGANLSGWTGKAIGDSAELRMSWVQLGGLNMADYDYLAFDLYVNDWNHAWSSGANDCNLLLGSDPGGNSWNSGDLWVMGAANFAAQLNNLQPGWNHVLLPIPTNVDGVQVIQMYSTACKITGENPYLIFDDVCFFNEKAMPVYEAHLAAKDVIVSIRELPEAVPANAEAINAVKAAYDALDDETKALVVNAEDLAAALAALEAYAQAVANVIDAIEALNVQSLDDQEAVEAARAAYNALTADQKADVTNYAKLEAAEAAIDALLDDQAAAAEAKVVEDMIDALPIVNEITLDNAEAIQAARAAYEALRDAAKEKVQNESVLRAAEAKLRQLLAENEELVAQAHAMEELIASLPAKITLNDKAAVEAVRAAFEALPEEVQQMVTNAPVLEAAEATIAALEETIANIAAAEQVDAQIAALGNVALTDAEAVAAAREAYDALTDAQKAFVANEPILKAAEAKIAALQKQAADKAAAQPVVDQIAALDVKSLDDQAAVEAARAAYDALTEDQQVFVANETDLIAAEAKIAKLAAADAAATAAAKAVEDQIAPFGKSSTMFNDCDNWKDAGGTEIVANYNSGSLDMEITEDGYAKYIFKRAGASDTPFTVRGDAVNLADISAVEFDLYLSEGITVDASKWANLHIQTGWGGIDDNKAASIKIGSLLGDLHTGWNHIVVDLSDCNVAGVNQLTIRIYQIFVASNAGDYVMLNDVVFKCKAKEVTLEDKEAIEAARAAYDELSDEAKAKVPESAVADLVAAEEAIAALEQEAADQAAADEVIAMIDALPEEAKAADREAIAAAREAYDALTDAQKAKVTNLDKWVAADEACKADEDKIAADKAAAKAVEDQINALPETITTEDAEAVEAARNAYDALSDDAKAYVPAEAVKALKDAEAAIADQKAAAEAKAVEDQIAALPENVTPADKEAVDAAKEAYDALSDAAKAKVSEEAVKTLNDAIEAANKTEDVTLGDVDGDGTIDAKDALLVLKAAVGKVELTDEQKAAANVNKDEAINAVDALEILKKAVGKPACF